MNWSIRNKVGNVDGNNIFFYGCIFMIIYDSKKVCIVKGIVFNWVFIFKVYNCVKVVVLVYKLLNNSNIF